MEAPDVYYAAAALSSSNFMVSKGDRTAFFASVLDTCPTTIPDLFRKLKLVTSSNFLGLDLYND